VIVHFGFAKPEQVDRAAKLGAIVSANPYYVTALAGRYALLGIGPERSKNMVPLGDVQRNKMSMSFHSDMPMAPAKPMQLVWAGVNRLTAEGDVAGPEHRVSVEAALRAITIDAAYSIQLEREVGSIEVGKFANLTILDQSPFDVSPDKLKEIAVWGTMLEGRVQPAPAVTQAASRLPTAREAKLARYRRLRSQYDAARLSGANSAESVRSAAQWERTATTPGCMCSAQVVRALAAAMVAEEDWRTSERP
jgi:hypothetical protein